jgi:hypothetical protein
LVGYAAAVRAERRLRVAVAVAGGLVVVLAVVLGVGIRVGANPADPVLEGVAFGALIAVPGVLALLGLRGRPDLWLPASWTAFPLAFYSLAGVTLPLLPASGVFLWAWVHKPNSVDRPRVPVGVVAPLVVVLVLGAVAGLYATPADPVSWSTPTGGGGSSDVVTNLEALACLTVLTLALGAAWFLSRPVAGH